MEPTAVIVVKVFPVGIPGTVIIQTETGGSAEITKIEAADVLEKAARQLRQD